MGTIHKTVKEVMELLSMLPEDLPVGGEDWNEGIGLELYYNQEKMLSSLQFLDLNNVHQDDEDWQAWSRCVRYQERKKQWEEFIEKSKNA